MLDLIPLDRAGQDIEKILNDLELVKQALESIGTDYFRTTLYGYDYDNATWRAIRVNAEGKVVGYLG